MKKVCSSFTAIIIVLALLPDAAVAAGATGFPSWSQHLTKGRFTVLPLFGNAAVIDKETGLVWEQSPSTDSFTWVNALSHCYQLEVGGRKGWRLPTIEELASLVDASQPAPTLPAGNPFSNVRSSSPYWSATSPAAGNSNISGPWYVFFIDGVVDNGFAKSDAIFVWCVRGGQGIDGVQ
jgi:hypothetical protein